MNDPKQEKIQEPKPDPIEALKVENAQLKQRLETAEPLFEAAKKYEVEPGEFVSRAEAAAGKIYNLIDEGVLDQDGMLIERQESESPKSSPSEQKAQVPDQTFIAPAAQAPTQEAIAQALAKTIEPLQQKIAQLESANNMFYRDKVMEKVGTTYPDLDDADVSQCLGISNQTGQDFWEVAKQVNEKKQTLKTQAVEKFAKENRIDLSEMNQLQQMRADGDGAAKALTEGKKIRFGAQGPGAITPRQATEQYIRLQNKLSE